MHVRDFGRENTNNHICHQYTIHVGACIGHKKNCIQIFSAAFVCQSRSYIYSVCIAQPATHFTYFHSFCCIFISINCSYIVI